MIINLDILDKYINMVRYIHHVYYRQVALMHLELGDKDGNALKDKAWEHYSTQGAKKLIGTRIDAVGINEISTMIYTAMTSLGLGVEVAPDGKNGFDILVSKCPDKASLEALGFLDRINCYDTCFTMANSMANKFNDRLGITLTDKMPLGQPKCRFNYSLSNDTFNLSAADFPPLPVEFKYDVMADFAIGQYSSFIITWAHEFGQESALQFVENTWSEVVRLAANDFSSKYKHHKESDNLINFLNYLWGGIGVKNTDIQALHDGSNVLSVDCPYGKSMMEWGGEMGLTCIDMCKVINNTASRHFGVPVDHIKAKRYPSIGNCSFEI